MANVIDGDQNNFARAQLATLNQHFAHLEVIEPVSGIPDFAVNQVLIAANVEIGELSIDPADGHLVDDIDGFLGENPLVLTDDFAPTDQLLS